MFRSNTFRPIEKKKSKKIKISALKDLARDEESSSPEGGYRGYKIRNAPKVRSKRSKRKSRWDADQNSLPVPNTKDILKQQGKRLREGYTDVDMEVIPLETSFDIKLLCLTILA